MAISIDLELSINIQPTTSVQQQQFPSQLWKLADLKFARRHYPIFSSMSLLIPTASRIIFLSSSCLRRHQHLQILTDDKLKCAVFWILYLPGHHCLSVICVGICLSSSSQPCHSQYPTKHWSLDCLLAGLVEMHPMYNNNIVRMHRIEVVEWEC